VETPSKFAVSLPEETNGGFVLTKTAVRMTGTGRYARGAAVDPILPVVSVRFAAIHCEPPSKQFIS
jgi:hypothetical protein